MSTKVKVNGRVYELVADDPTQSLLQTLRESLQLRGTKNACEQGNCGSCTVLVNSRPVYSCLILLGQVNECSAAIETIEGISSGGTGHTVQRAFEEQAAAQCGFCTPGMVVSAVALLRNCPAPREDQVRTALAGNLCRCTGYDPIVDAVLAASKEHDASMESNQPGPPGWGGR